MASITWCMKLFPFEDCFARYICILGAGDDRPEVYTEASLGLVPSSFSKETKQNTSHQYPAVATFLSFVLSHTDWYYALILKSIVFDKLCFRYSKQKSRSIPAKVYEKLVSFIRNCRGIPDLDTATLEQLLGVIEGALAQGNPDSLIIAAMESIVSLLSIHLEPISNQY